MHLFSGRATDEWTKHLPSISWLGVYILSTSMLKILRSFKSTVDDKFVRFFCFFRNIDYNIAFVPETNGINVSHMVETSHNCGGCYYYCPVIGAFDRNFLSSTTRSADDSLMRRPSRKGCRLFVSFHRPSNQEIALKPHGKEHSCFRKSLLRLHEKKVLSPESERGVPFFQWYHPPSQPHRQEVRKSISRHNSKLPGMKSICSSCE
ncbi:hypothetical protein R3P38DRAFT_496363 [Favolaschia claudopus]|uniref:Uncharacterized protein n=1 Tax=Favolaschia claudopus TaxID=2862362 RepID=A0AAW0CKD1_9AGAR